MSSGSTTDTQSTDRTINTPAETDEGASVASADTTRPESVVAEPKKKLKSKNSAKESKVWTLAHKNGKKKKAKEEASSDEESDSDSEDESEEDTDSASDESSEDEKSKKKRKLKKKQKKASKKKSSKKSKKAVKKGKRSIKDISDSESDGSESDASDVSESGSDTGTDSDAEVDDDTDELAQMNQLMALQVQQQQQQLQQLQIQPLPLMTPIRSLHTPVIYGTAAASAQRKLAESKRVKKLKAKGLDAKGKKIKDTDKTKSKERVKAGSKLEYKRVDQLWDTKTHQYKLSDTAEDDDASIYDQYLFNVRRTFDWEGQYRATLVDIKSKLLKEALGDLLDGIRGVSLAEETPVIDPNFLFLYLEDLREAMRALRKKVKSEKKMKRKLRKRNELKIQHVKVLLKYLDVDYAETKKTLYPMLESGLITFDLLWALYKPNTIAYTTTYGSTEQPRAFKVEYAEKECSFQRGQWYCIEGKYLEYDGKIWGMGDVDVDVVAFKGARKITSLACYPICYHKDEAKLRADLIERGKKFVSLQGVQYKSHEGMAYVKRRRQIIKVNINGRIMVDPAIHRRINPNYQISSVKANEPEDVDDSDDDDCDSDGCEEEGETTGVQALKGLGDEDAKIKIKRKIVLDDKKKPHLIEVEIDADGEEIRQEKLAEVPSKKESHEEIDKKDIPVFTDEEYLIASPVVLGFAFAEKLWLEFTVSGIKDITWNEGAYESLVLENNTKDIVKALVESHKYHPAQSIDDVIQGKGLGLVAVLHGPPGTGKTLTAEGISEFLKCPLYMVSAGELGTNPRELELELQKILDIAHAWGAVLLLDEADVFLEKRTIMDIHRNALVSIFLRLLEYFQGILFLTTNRVETFDDAFQSRIHIALRYGALSLKAKKAVFKMFIEKAKAMENVPDKIKEGEASQQGDSKINGRKADVILKGERKDFTEIDYLLLARYELNGRQIKNTVRTAQALAVNKGEVLKMEHLKKVLDVAISFDRDLKGGTGYEDAMRSYQ